ncbi:unnamed protein product, partial [Rotaria sp. Silwood1]
MNSFATPTNLCSQCASFFVQSIRYLPRSFQAITNDALKQFSSYINTKQVQHSKVIKLRQIDKQVTTTVQQVFNVKIESLLNELSKEELQKLSLSPVSSTSCFSCQVGITQHIKHTDLLKIQNLVFNQIRGFKTRHSSSTGVGRHTGAATSSTARIMNAFDTHRSSTVVSEKEIKEERFSYYPKDSNLPPSTTTVSR